MTHSDLLLISSGWLDVRITSSEARSLVSAHERLLEERDALSIRAKAAETARDEARRLCDGSCDIALARRQVGPDGLVPGNAKECAEMWEREAARLSVERREVEKKRDALRRDRDEEQAHSRAFAHAADTEKAEAKTWRARALAAESSLSRLRGQVEALAEALRYAVKELEWWGDHFHDEPGEATAHYIEALTGCRAALRSLASESAEDHKDKRGES